MQLLRQFLDWYQRLILYNKLTTLESRKSEVSNYDSSRSPDRAILQRIQELNQEDLEKSLTAYGMKKIGLSELIPLQFGRVEPIIEIAATEPMFSQEAFRNSKARILKYSK